MPFKRGVAARDYRFRLSASMTRSRSDNVWTILAGTEHIVTWGNVFSALHGVRALVDNWQSGANEYHRIRIWTPWGDYDSGTVAGWLTPSVIDFEFDGVTLDSPDCDEWTFEFDAFRAIADGSTLITVGATTQNGFDFDLRLVCQFLAGESAPDPNPYDNILPCTGDYSTQLVRSRSGSCSISSSGYDWRLTAGPGAWTEDDVLVDTSHNPPPVSAACSPIDCTVGLADMEDSCKSKHFSMVSDFDDPITKGGFATVSCPCPDPRPGDIDAVWEIWYGEEDHYRRKSTVTLMPVDAGILEYKICRTAVMYCPIPGDAPPSAPVYCANYTKPQTYCSYTREARALHRKQWCHKIITPGSCGLIGEDPPPDIQLCTNLQSFVCAYYALVTSEWPRRAVCDAGDYHLTRGGSGLLYAAEVVTAGARVWAFDFRSHDETVLSVSGTIGSAQVAWGRGGRIYLVYTEGGNVKIKWSLAQGNHVSAAETIAAGSAPAIAIYPSGEIYVALYSAGWKLYRQTRDGESWALVGTISAYTGTRAALEISPANDNPLVCILDAGAGSLRRLRTMNRGATWAETHTIGAGTLPAFAIDPMTGDEYVAGLSAGAWKIWSRGAREASFTAMTSPVSATGLAGLEVARHAEGYLTFVVSSGGRRRWTSMDRGETWTER